jgi:hypothetical protein
MAAKQQQAMTRSDYEFLSRMDGDIEHRRKTAFITELSACLYPCVPAFGLGISSLSPTRYNARQECSQARARARPVCAQRRIRAFDRPCSSRRRPSLRLSPSPAGRSSKHTRRIRLGSRRGGRTNGGRSVAGFSAGVSSQSFTTARLRTNR